MQVGYSRDTAVLGCVATALAVFVCCVGATRLSMNLSTMFEPALGDHVAIPASGSSAAWSVQAQLPSGRSCEIGIGTNADQGGDLYVVSRNATGTIEAIWSAKGRSSATGPDCGSGAKVTVDPMMFSSLGTASQGLSPTASGVDTPVF